MNMVNQTFTCISLLCMLGLLINKNADKTTANDYNRWCGNSSNCSNNNHHHGSSSGGGSAAAAYEEYRHLLIGTLRYAISKLNQKAIYANMVAFSSKVLGACFPPFFLTLYYIEISFVYPCVETK